VCYLAIHVTILILIAICFQFQHSFIFLYYSMLQLIFDFICSLYSHRFQFIFLFLFLPPFLDTIAFAHSAFISSFHPIQNPPSPKKLRGFSSPANYTDRATATYRRSYCQLQRIEDIAWSAQRIPTAVNFGFLDRSRYFSFK
jgi:hypothetical protein